MTLTITDDHISSDRTAHSARPVHGQQHAWEVSWLPGRSLDRNSAITAMVLADVTAPGGVHAGHRDRIHVEGWAAELGITADRAATRIAAPPAWTAIAETAPVPADPEAGA